MVPKLERERERGESTLRSEPVSVGGICSCRLKNVDLEVMVGKIQIEIEIEIYEKEKRVKRKVLLLEI